MVGLAVRYLQKTISGDGRLLPWRALERVQLFPRTVVVRDLMKYGACLAGANPTTPVSTATHNRCFLPRNRTTLRHVHRCERRKKSPSTLQKVVELLT